MLPPEIVVDLKRSKLDRVLKPLAAIAIPVTITILGVSVDRHLRTAEVEVKKLEVTSRILETLQERHDDARTATALLASFGSTAAPGLLALLETEAAEIETLLGEDARWPLPEYLLSPSCTGDPRYSEQSSLQSNDALREHWLRWRSINQALRMLDTSVLDRIEELTRQAESSDRTRFVIRVLLELKPDLSRRKYLRSVVAATLFDLKTDPETRGDALALLAYGQGDRIEIPNNTSLDLACRQLPKLSLYGRPRRGRPDLAGGVPSLNLDRTEFTAGSELEGMRFAFVNLNKTLFGGISMRDCSFGGRLLQASETDQAASFDKSQLENVLFQSVDLTGTSFTNSELISVMYSRSNLADAKFDGSVFQNVHFDQSDLFGSFFQGVVVERLDFCDVSFHAARFMPSTGSPRSSWAKWWSPSVKNRGYRGVCFSKQCCGSAVSVSRQLQGAMLRRVPVVGEDRPDWLAEACDSGFVSCITQ